MGDRHAVGVAAEIAENVFGTTKGRLAVDDPVLTEEGPEERSEHFRFGQKFEIPVESSRWFIFMICWPNWAARGVIRQTEFFLYTKNDRQALDGAGALGHKYPECTGWIRCQRRFPVGQGSWA